MSCFGHAGAGGVNPYPPSKPHYEGATDAQVSGSLATMGGCDVMGVTPLFSPHLCVGLLFLFVHSRLLPPPPARCLPHTQLVHKQLTHPQLAHTHNLHKTYPHNLLSHTHTQTSINSAWWQRRQFIPVLFLRSCPRYGPVEYASF